VNRYPAADVHYFAISSHKASLSSGIVSEQVLKPFTKG
jgi:hypothetical protein